MVLRKCTVCSRVFKKSEHYKRHERSHTKERPYECNVCHKSFSRSDVLSRHAKGHNQTNTTAGPLAAQDRQPSIVAESLIPGASNVAVSTGESLSTFPGGSHLPLEAGLPSSLDYLSTSSAHRDCGETGLNTAMIEDQQANYGWNEVTPAYQMDRADLASDPVPKDMLQMWLEPRTDTVTDGSLDITPENQLPIIGEGMIFEPSPNIQSLNGKSGGDHIPNERFFRVQRCWLAPPNTGRLINSLWRDIAISSIDNIFSVQSLHFSTTPGMAQGSRCGFDEDCRRRLQAAFGNNSAALHINSVVSSNTPVSASPYSDFPPPEIFDMSLDLFFRLFHPLLPIVHIPTFSTKKARPSLLYVMTLIGMALLGTQGTSAFVSNNFSAVLEKVTAEFARCSLGRENTTSTMTVIATGLLLLQLAGLTGVKAHLEQCQLLYVNIISFAQRHGFFSVTEGQALEKTLFETIPDMDMRWKTWAKIESTKRIIIGLLLLDSWYSSFLSTSPILLPDSIQLNFPCSEALFRAQSSAQWTNLLRRGERLISSTIEAPSENVKVPALEAALEDFSIQAVLAMLQLRQSEAYHRLISNKASYPFAPCHTYAMDRRAGCLPSLQFQIVTTYGEVFDRLSIDTLVSWHYMCMTMLADIQIFDLAAGRAGPTPARKSLDDIREWSQTPAARRACLHAAHIYKAMANRKTSDHPTFQSVFSLFSAGLILGLYTFMVPELASLSSSSLSMELMDDVDWISVGMEALTGLPEARESHTQALSEDPAVDFIRNGATIYLRNSPLHGGYQSARRILLDYASLLKDSGKWSVNQFSHILYIMSDVLLDVE